MKRTQLNFAIDTAAFAAFLFLVSSGLLLRYQLPAGSGGLHGVGAGRGAADRPVAILWGLSRHDWGAIHYWTAGLLIAILAVHLVLHWKWIICVVGGKQREASGVRFGLGLAAVVALVLIAAAPLLAPIERVSRGEFERGNSESDLITQGTVAEIRGSMTLTEVAEAANLSVAQVLEELDLPPDVSPNERIGRLLRQHGLEMSDSRNALRESTTNDSSPERLR
jgi:hypothetical protein